MAQEGICTGALAPWDINLYDRSVLEDIDLESWKNLTFKPKITIEDPGECLFLRPLRIYDHERGFLKLLEQLTSVGDVSEEKFKETFKRMKTQSDTYYVTVIEDCNTGDVIGSATLFLEQKFIHDCAKRARIEDVVVDDRFRGKQLGKLLVVVLVLLAKKLGCYKISLDCKDTMIPFYEGLGFSKEPSNGNFLVIRY